MSEKTKYLTPRISPLKKRDAYQVGRVLYATPQAAAKKIAWMFIFQKYAGIEDNPNMALSGIKKILDIECECAERHARAEYGEVIQYKFEECPIHDRKSGYFARLHKMMTQKILLQWGIK